MGYFSNGTESEMYQEEYCSNCVHDEDCVVWLAHLIHSYEDCNKPQSILHLLIPRNGIYNEQCKMFIRIS